MGFNSGFKGLTVSMKTLYSAVNLSAFLGLKSLVPQNRANQEKTIFILRYVNFYCAFQPILIIFVFTIVLIIIFVIIIFFSCGAATQRGSWPLHS